MKQQIMDLVINNPKHYTLLIRKSESLMQWVNNNTLISLDSPLSAKIYSAVYQTNNLCPNGNVKKFNRWSTGFVNCGPAKYCKCTANDIASAVSRAKQNYNPEKHNAVNTKRKNTMIEKYGVAYNSQRPEVKSLLSKPKISNEAHTKLTNKEWLEKEYMINQRSTVDIASELGVYYSTVASYCASHGFAIRRRSKYSMTEVAISDYLTELGVAHETSNWEVLGNKELDIFISSHNFAIEVNGLYWHSYNPAQKSSEDVHKHLNKTKSALLKGVDVFHVTDWEWNNKQEIIKSMIANKLGKTSIVVPARKCIVKRLTTNEAKNFFEANHLQGHINSSMYLGLEYNGTVVMAMTAGHSRFDKRKYTEIHRLAAGLNVNVVGGASKLLKYLTVLLPDTNIITYCDRDKSNGAVYHKLGFTLVRETGPGYFWTDGTEIVSRYKSMKKNLAKWLPSYDPSLSESANMFNAGFRRYWNCGNLVFELSA